LYRHEVSHSTLYGFDAFWLIIFSRSLAYCELYLLLAMLTVRVFPRMQLYKTTEEDIIYDHDIFNPLPVSTSKGVRATIV
jgi:hypothetical protein